MSKLAGDPKLSKALFGSSHMQSVILAITEIDHDEFTAPEIMDITGLAASSVHTLISRLHQSRLIARVEAAPGERTVRYQRADAEALAVLAHVGERPAE